MLAMDPPAGVGTVLERQRELRAQSERFVTRSRAWASGDSVARLGMRPYGSDRPRVT
jgi:hypothetical protein